jgi:hypothetical protein
MSPWVAKVAELAELAAMVAVGAAGWAAVAVLMLQGQTHLALSRMCPKVATPPAASAARWMAVLVMLGCQTFGQIFGLAAPMEQALPT